MSKSGAFDLATGLGGKIDKDDVISAVDRYEKYYSDFGGVEEDRKANYTDMALNRVAGVDKTCDFTKSLTEKQAKDLLEKRGNSILDNLNSRERKIKDIKASFEACKSHPVHATNKKQQKEI